MSRGKKDEQNFNHSPFKTLKGLSVSELPEKPADVPATPVPSTHRESDDHQLFAREMAWLKVRPVDGGKGGAEDGQRSAEPVPDDNGSAAEFLAAVGQLDKTFKDEQPPGNEPSRARARRMKQLERGELKPAGELDLHGLTRDEALTRTRAFLGHAARQNWPVVLLVTGKGLHSAEGPVLRQAIERLLDTSRELVLEWGGAPRRFGGAGALVVFLRVGSRIDGSGATINP